MSLRFHAVILLMPLVVLGGTAAIAVARAGAGSALNGRLLDRHGKAVGSIRQEPLRRYSVFDAQSRRLGYGRESADGRAIEFFAPDGRRLFELRPEGTPRGLGSDRAPAERPR